MRKVIYLVLVLSLTAGMVMAESEWKGSLKAGIFQNKSTMLKSVKVSMADAIKISESQLKGVVTKAELDKEEGYLVYCVELTDTDGEDREILIDPVTGNVLEKDDVDSDEHGE